MVIQHAPRCLAVGTRLQLIYLSQETLYRARANPYMSTHRHRGLRGRDRFKERVTLPSLSHAYLMNWSHSAGQIS